MVKKENRLDEEIRILYAEARSRVDKTLSRINIAIKLGAAQRKARAPSADFQYHLRWKNSLEYWKERYESETEDPEWMAESLGALYELCLQIK